ncbi:MAG: ParB/RepB/Spo0J family partition protein [Candidatus Manganitrophus sp. SA1]|nr:ParB/RepB/Spo0J family partition protein [Candidatus Manganitrophus morganii]
MKRNSKDPPDFKTKTAEGPGWQSLERKKQPVRPWTVGVDPPADQKAGPSSQTGTANAFVQVIKIDQIRPDPKQPRRTFSQKAISDLARSIAEVDLLEPILVRPDETGGFCIIAGERRWRACKSLKHESIKAIVRETTPTEAFKLSIIENLIREQLNIVEKALGFKELLRQKIYPSQSAMASELGLHRTNIVKTLRLLERLHEEAIGYYLDHYDHLTEGHLHAVMRAPIVEQRTILERVKAESWSVQQTRHFVTTNFFPTQRSNNIALKEKQSDWFDLEVRVRPTMRKPELQALIGTLKQTIHKLEALAKNKTEG